MAQKTESGPEVLSLKLRQTDASWEHQEKTVYTVEALEREIREKLAPKKEASKEEASD